jgi:hypothetical protein
LQLSRVTSDENLRHKFIGESHSGSHKDLSVQQKLVPAQVNVCAMENLLGTVAGTAQHRKCRP